METDISTGLDEYSRVETDRPLGDLKSVSNRAAHRFSQPLHAGADNLLSKASKAIEQGDRGRAQGYIARAARIPFDEFEERAPGPWSAHMMLFSSVTDALELCDRQDSSWLDAALAVLGSCGEDARLDLMSVLDVLQQDYQLLGRENRRIRAVVAGTDAEAELQARLDSGRTTPDRVILEVLEAAIAFEQAVAG